MKGKSGPPANLNTGNAKETSFESSRDSLVSFILEWPEGRFSFLQQFTLKVFMGLLASEKTRQDPSWTWAAPSQSLPHWYNGYKWIRARSSPSTWKSNAFLFSDHQMLPFHQRLTVTQTNAWGVFWHLPLITCFSSTIVQWLGPGFGSTIWAEFPQFKDMQLVGLG